MKAGISNNRVLIVDDEPANIRMLGEALRGGFKLVYARNGEKALDHAFSQKPPDLILLDILMPGMDGFEVCRQLKADPRTRDIPIIFITAMSHAEDEAKGFGLGAADYITKPFSPTRVRARVMTHLDLKRHRSNLEDLLSERTSELLASNEKLKQEIEERKRLEKEAEINRQRLVQADKMIALGVLVSGVAHEINNPNNFIMLNAPIVEAAWESIIPILDEYYEYNGEFKVAGITYSDMRKEIHELFTGIREGAERITHIVKNLKNYAREDDPDMSELVDINSVMESALTLLSNQIKKSTESFEVTYGQDLPQVLGNAHRLGQVFVNLLQNSCQAIKEVYNGIRVVIYHDKEENAVIVEVQDEGVGICEQDLKHIYDPFFTTRRDMGGTGLGLSICVGIVEEHGGELEFFSEPGKGTTAKLTLPVAKKTNKESS